jgi:hypothetical protein
VVNLELQRLQSVAAALPESERDPFRFRPKAPPPAPRAQTPPPPVFTPSVAADSTASPTIALKYFGVMTIQGELVAAFIDGRGNTFRGKEGDILEGRYRLLRVGRDSADLAYLDGRGRQTIRLTGQ